MNATVVTVVVWAGALGNIFASIPYVRATWRGQAAPQRVTWTIWGLATVTVLLAQLGAGSPPQAWALTAVLAVLPIAVVLASLSNPDLGWAWTPTNIVCGVLGGVGLVVWMALSSDPLWAVVLGSVVGTVAAVPTAVNAWQNPGQERHLPYITLAISAAATLAVIATPWPWGDAVYLGNLVVMNLAISGLLFAAQRRERRRQVSRVTTSS
ncbi:MAG: hypothetical protein H7Y15_17730 [Pseudonocardia sp.]|nr:hypothetical protein [Pseudonocardia sp.]